MEHRKKNFKPFAREHGLGFRGGHGKKWVQRRRGSEHFQEYSYEARGYGPREAHDLQEKHGRHRYERCSDDSDPSDLRDKLGRCHHERTSDEFQDFNPEERRFTEQYHHRESYNLHEKCTRRGHKGTSDKQFDLSPEKQTCLKKYSWERSHRASSSESVREQYHQQYTWRGQSTTPHRGHFCHPRSHVRMTSAHVPQDRSPEDIGGGANARWEAESPHYGNKREVVVADRRDQLPVSGMDFSFGPSSSSHQGMHNGHSSLQHCPRKFSLGPSAPGPHRPSNFSPSPTYHRHRSSYPRDTLLSPLHDWGEPYLRDSSPWLPHHHKLRARDFSSRSSHDLSPPPDPKGFHAQPPDARNHSLSRARKGDLPYHRSPHGNHDHPQYRGESQTPRTGPKQQSPIRAPSGQRSRPQGRHFCYDANRVGQLERYSRWSRAEDNSSRKPEYRTRSDYHGASSKHDTDRKEGSDRRAVSSQRGSDASTSWHVRRVILKGKKGGSSAGQGKSTSSEGSSAPSETGKSIGENMPKKTLGNETCDKGMSRSMQEQSEGICRKDPDLLTSPQRMVENLDKQKQESKTTSRERDGTTTVMLAHPEQRAEKSENQEQSEHTFREETDADILVSPQREAESANKQSQEGLAIVAEMKIVDNTASVSEVPESQDSTTSCPPGDPSTPAPFLWCRESTSQQDPPNVDGADKDSSADTSDNEFHSFQAVDTNPVCEMLRVCAISETNTSSTTETRIPQAHSGPDSVEMADISSLRNSPSRDQLGESADIEASPLDDQPKIISETDIPGMQTPAECHPSSTLTAGVSKSQSSSDVPPHLGEDIQLTNASNWQVASVEDQSEEIQSETTVASDYRLASVYDLRENTPATGTSDMQASLPEDQSQNIEMTEPSPASPPGDLNDQTASEGLERNANIYQPEVTPVSDDEDIPLSGLVAERAQHSPYRPVLSPVSDYAGSPVAGQKEPLDMRLHLGSSSQSFSVCQQLAFCQIPRMPTDFAAASVSEEYVQEPEVYDAESMCRHGVSPVSDDGEDITHSGHVMHEVKGPTLGFTESLYQPVASPVSEASADEGDAALEPVYDDHLQLQVAGTTDKENVSAVENLGGSQSPGDSPGSMASPKSAKTDLSSDRLDAAGGTGTEKSSLASGDSLVLDLSDIESQYLEIAEPLQSPAAGDPSDDVGEDLTARETLHHSLNSASTGTNAVISISQDDRGVHLSDDGESSDELSEEPAFLTAQSVSSKTGAMFSRSTSSDSSVDQAVVGHTGGMDQRISPEPGNFQTGSGTSSKQTCAFSLDSLLQDKKRNDAMEEEMKAMQAELRAGIEKGGIEALELEERDGDDDEEDQHFTTEQRDVLSRLQMEDRQIADYHPGEKVLQAELCGRFFTESLLPCNCGFANTRGSNVERMLELLQPANMMDILSSDIIPMTFRSLPSKEPVLKWLLFLASVHSDGLVVLKCADQIQEVLQWQLEEIMGGGPTRHTWSPAIEDISHLFVNWGAPAQDEVFGKPSLGSEHIREELPAGPWKISKGNVQSVLQILSACLQSRPAYSSTELTKLLLMISRLALDTSFCNQGALYELPVCMSSILECYSANKWHTSVPSVCRQLSTLTSHHHNQVYLAQLFPAVSQRCLYLRQRLAYLMLRSAVSQGSGDGAVSDEVITNFQLSQVVSLIPRLRGLLESDLYHLSSLVHLLDMCVGSAFMLSSQQKQLYKLIESVRYMVSDMRDNVRRLDLIKVKDVLVRLCSKWDLALKSSNIRQRKIFACYSSQDSPVKMEPLQTSGVDDDDDSDDSEADASSVTADDEEDTMDTEGGEQSTSAVHGENSWPKTEPKIELFDGEPAAMYGNGLSVTGDWAASTVKAEVPCVEQSMDGRRTYTEDESDDEELPEL